MATTVATVLPLAEKDEQRNPRPYHPSLWGDFFLNYKPCTPSQHLSMKDKAEVMKEEVRKMILDTASSSDLPLKLELVDTLQRLGLDYHYRKEIDELLCGIHEGGDDDHDLHTTSLRFYLLRKHGYHVSSDVFLKFRDDEGNFASNDTRSLLALYNAAHLRTHGEEILDNAIVFTKNHLQSVVEDLESPLADEVRCTLETPLFRRLKRVEARHYISVYEKMTTRNETILEFAKLDFNILQTLYCEELKALTIWWKELQLQADLSFARDRMVEMHFWMLGVLFEPQYSYSRIMLTKLFIFVSIFDDIYDNYSTTEESKIFTTAMERWDEEAAEQLPGYMKAFYINILTTINAIEEELKLQKNKHADYVKKLLIDVTKCYYDEVKWRDEHYVPATVEEHLQISVPSSGCMHIASLAFISMGDVTTSDAIEWALTYPKIIRAFCIVGRIVNDIASHEREQASEHVASTVQTCMKEYGITIEEAYEKLRELIEESWMDIVEECLRPAQTQPTALLETVVNLARTMDFLYKDEDAYTHPRTLKDIIDSMYVNSI
nr:terpene synthase clade-I-ancestor [synthetic construct]